MTLTEKDFGFVAKAMSILSDLLDEEQIAYLYDMCLNYGETALLSQVANYSRTYDHYRKLLSLHEESIEDVKSKSSQKRFAQMVLYTLWVIHYALSPDFLFVKDFQIALLQAHLKLQGYARTGQSFQELQFWPFWTVGNPFLNRVLMNNERYGIQLRLLEKPLQMKYLDPEHSLYLPNFVPIHEI